MPEINQGQYWQGGLFADLEIGTAPAPVPVPAPSRPNPAPSPSLKGETVTLAGEILSFRFQQMVGDFIIAQFEYDQTSDPTARSSGVVTIKGDVPAARQGVRYELLGTWIEDPKYGLQFQVMHSSQALAKLPSNRTGLERWLAEKVDGVGPATARHLVEAFGDQAFAVLNEQPERIALEVPKIKPAQAEAIIAAWRADAESNAALQAEQEAARDLAIFCFSQGLGNAIATKAIARWGAGNASAVVQTEPYRLIELDGVGFTTADQVAQVLGFALDSPERIRAGLLHGLKEATGEGHVYLPYDKLVESGSILLGLDTRPVAQVVGAMIQSKDLIAESADLSDEEAMAGVEDTLAIYLPRMARAEGTIVERLKLVAIPVKSRLSAFQAQLKLVADPLNYLKLKLEMSPLERCRGLNDDQLTGLLNVLRSPVSILTGGPGTGKTTSMLALLYLLKGYRVALIAPTGRAAKKLSQATAQARAYGDTESEAKTIHRALGMQGDSGAADYDEEKPLPFDLIIVDETSMVDTSLMSTLVRAIAPGTHLLLVGDSDQLPSVGPGKVLGDLIGAGRFPVVHLTQVYRQSETSHIVSNAALIKQGRIPRWGEGVSDFYFFEAEEPVPAADQIVKLVLEEIPKKFGLTQNQIQVLSPMKIGGCGVIALNRRLQAVLNPPSYGRNEIKLGKGESELVLREGDAVMHLKNDYTKKVFNGDTGRIAVVNQAERKLMVRLDDGGPLIAYEYSELGDLTLAYACTVHKSQGSEFPALVMPVLTGHYVMLQRNLLYTGVTRGKELVVLVGSEKALRIALRNNNSKLRFTRLKEKLVFK
jgi:exodeoxyribonuclease V alpha subunit